MTLRPPAVAGRFYPGQRDTLEKTVADHIAGASVVVPAPNVGVVIAPHAGYPYSGPTAGHAFRRVQGKSVRHVYLLGPSHHYRFRGISLDHADHWQTPLGDIPVETEMVQELVHAFGNHCPEAHGPEHALEVELPFLQLALQGTFAIVPVLFGAWDSAFHNEVAAWIAAYVTPDDLLIASTDLSHFLPEGEANAIDKRSLDAVLKGAPDGLETAIVDGSASMCGATAVYTALVTANLLGATNRYLWDYRTSGAATGDYSRVVGYGAATLEYESPL